MKLNIFVEKRLENKILSKLGVLLGLCSFLLVKVFLTSLVISDFTPTIKQTLPHYKIIVDADCKAHKKIKKKQKNW